MFRRSRSTWVSGFSKTHTERYRTFTTGETHRVAPLITVCSTFFTFLQSFIHVNQLPKSHSRLTLSSIHFHNHELLSGPQYITFGEIFRYPPCVRITSVRVNICITIYYLYESEVLLCRSNLIIRIRKRRMLHTRRPTKGGSLVCACSSPRDVNSFSVQLAQILIFRCKEKEYSI